MHGNMTPNKKQKSRATTMRAAFINAKVRWLSPTILSLANAVQSGITRKVGIRPLALQAGAK